MRRTLFAILGIIVLFSTADAQAQTQTNTPGNPPTATLSNTGKDTNKEAPPKKESKKSKKKKEVGTADDSAAPDKILYDRALVDIKKGRHEVGRLNLQTLINTYPDSEYLAKAKLAIADSYFKEGGNANWTQAIAGYKDFIVFFPFLPEAPYAQIQVAMTHYREMEKPDRDRTEAKAAEEEFQTFLAKYPKDPLVTKAEQHLRVVQEVLAEGDYRIGYYYYVKGDRRAAAGRLLSVTKRYPLYSKSDQALWMLGDIFEKSEKKEVASVYYSRIVKDYPLSALVPDAKKKLLTFGVPVPQPDPKQLAWMQAEAAATREKPSLLSKPMSLIRTGPGTEKMVAARTGTPNMEPEADTTSVADILTGGGKAQIGAGGGSGATGNTNVIAVVTPGTGASGGSTVEAGDTGATETPAPGTDANPGGTANPPSTDTGPAAAATDSATPATTGTDGTAAGAATDPNAKPADNAATDPKKESSSKKKKGLKKIIPW
ncbi:MAG TPA: outer membrane protein assembly factor BamD [Candidatus Eisenbacteria bacterium]|nr:outer membrane protein assembly factor BamD [Candidatus Eisenbacteria bacterium]